MQGKIILVTGSTDGIGKQTALELAAMGARVLLHGRDRGRAEKALKEIRKATGNEKLEFFIADLASQKQIRDLSRQILEKHDRLDVLINNAGVYEKKRRLTEDGFERTFAINHLAPFLLTHLLLPLLKKSAPSRIINVSSQAHASSIDFGNLQAEKHYDAYDAYALSKLANIMFTYELAQRLGSSGVTVNCLHPGVIATKLLRSGWAGGGSPVTEGSKTSVYLASAPDLEGVSGRYFVDRRQASASSISRDEETRKILWRLSEKMTGL